MRAVDLHADTLVDGDPIAIVRVELGEIVADDHEVAVPVVAHSDPVSEI